MHVYITFFCGKFCERVYWTVNQFFYVLRAIGALPYRTWDFNSGFCVGARQLDLIQFPSYQKLNNMWYVL